MTGICDGCGMLVEVTRGVCSMCRLDGVPLMETRAQERARLAADFVCSGPPDTFPTMARERARALAIRAEDPEGWEAVMGPLRKVDERTDEERKAA